MPLKVLFRLFFIIPSLLYAEDVIEPQMDSSFSVVSDTILFTPISLSENIGLTLLFPAAASFKSEAYVLSGLQLLIDAAGALILVKMRNVGGEASMGIIIVPILFGINRIVSLPLNALSAVGYNRRQGKSFWNSKESDQQSSRGFHPYEGDQHVHVAFDLNSYMVGRAGESVRIGAMIGYEAWSLHWNYNVIYDSYSGLNDANKDSRTYSLDFGYRFQPSKRFSYIPTVEIAQGTVKYSQGTNDNIQAGYQQSTTKAYTDIAGLIYGSLFLTESLEGSLVMGYPLFQSGHYHQFSNQGNSFLHNARFGYRISYHLL